MPWKHKKLSGSQDLREPRDELSRKTMGQEHTKEGGHSRAGTPGGDMEQRQGVSNDPSMLERGRDVPLADMDTHVVGRVRGQG